MTSLFQARRRAEEFAAALDGGAANRHAGGAEITPLLEVVAALRDHASAQPRPAFVTDLRSRLMLEAETALSPETANLLLPPRQHGRRERRLAAAASAFVLIGGTTTMAAAAQNALPGDPLYPIKRGIESAEARLNLNTAGRGEDLLRQASSRLAEVDRMLAGSTAGSDAVAGTLEEFSTTAADGSTLLFDSFRESGDPATIVAVRTFTTEGIAKLEQLSQSVPADAQDELTAAAILVHDIDSEAAELCSGCAADLPLVEVPGILLARAEVDRALALAATRRLANSHPVVVPEHTAALADDAAQAAQDTPAAPTTGDTATDTGPASPPLPAPSVAPDSWPSLVPDLDGGSSTTSDSATTDDATTSLSDVVETLLPDPDGSLLD